MKTKHNPCVLRRESQKYVILGVPSQLQNKTDMILIMGEEGDYTLGMCARGWLS